MRIRAEARALPTLVVGNDRCGHNSYLVDQIVATSDALRMKVSVRELKNRLSEHLRRVKAGQSIVVTAHDKPVARLCAVPSESASGVQRMLDAGLARWNAKKPRGAGRRQPVKLRGPGMTMSERALADCG